MPTGDSWKRDPAVVLIVDDDPVDQLLVELGIREVAPGVECRFAGDGKEALSYLTRSTADGGSDSAPKPDLVLLDLNLPQLGGLGTLEVLREDPRTRDIPVIILTTSESREDVDASYRLGANAFVTKAPHVSDLYAALRGALAFGLAGRAVQAVP